MTGLEQMALSMLQKMTGLNETEMRDMADNAVKLIQSIDARMSNMETTLNRIEQYLMPEANVNPMALLEGTTYDNRNDSNTNPGT